MPIIASSRIPARRIIRRGAPASWRAAIVGALAAPVLLSLAPRAAQAQPPAAADRATTQSLVRAAAAPAPLPPASADGKQIRVELDVPPSREAIPMLPPLSIEECIAGLKMIESRLANPEIGMERWDPKETARVFEYLNDYIQLTDRKHSSLGNYTWNLLGENGVAVGAGITDRDTYYVTPALPNVSAISFTAAGGNILLEKIEVVDIANRRIEIPVKKTILANLPRREVGFLYLPATVKEVVTHAEALSGQPRLTLFGGISRRPEYLKAAQHYMLEAQKAILDGQRDAAHAAIADAEKQLTFFLNR